MNGSMIPSTASGRRSPSHEAIRAGALGATVVWLWLFVSDWLHGTPWYLATLFGRGLLGVVDGAGAISRLQAVMAFTIAHFVYWCVLAVVVLAVVRAAVRTPAVLSLGITVFILFQFLFVGVTAILANSGLGVFAWPSVLLGNIAGWAVAWWYILRRHPELGGEVRRMNDDD